jgi:hypothetical protein
VAPSPKQKLDGVSFADVLRGKKRLEGRAYFNFFPHGGPTKPPGVTVRQGDFKLIRWYLTGPEYPELIELYDLRDDLSESKNLASAMPDKVRELEGLIDGFLRDTGALVPTPNPDYKPGATKKPVAKAPPSTTPDGKPATVVVDVPINGWRARGCTAELKGGKLIVTGENKSPFLGIAGLKLSGAAVLTLQTAEGSGVGKVQWRMADQEEFPAEGQVAEFTIADGGPAVTEVKLPVKGQLAHVRLYLPAQTKPVVVERIMLTATGGKPREWDFGK